MATSASTSTLALPRDRGHPAIWQRPIALRASAEERKSPPPRERIHAALDAGADLLVLRLDVVVVGGALGVIVELDRLAERGADLRRQRHLRQQRRRQAPGGLEGDREHLQAGDLVEPQEAGDAPAGRQ